MGLKIGLLELHQNFRNEFMQSAMLNSSRISAIPTYMFLVFSFILIYGLLHRRTTRFTSFKVRLYRDLAFHWSYFYITKIWFLLVRGTKYIVEFVDNHLELRFTGHTRVYLNSNFIRGIAFSVLLSVAAIPAILLFIKIFYKQSVPNFLLWIPEDPWMGSEIGVAGHYLDRPPIFTTASKRKKIHSYHIRKSSSLDELIERSDIRLIIRNCKSMEHCATSLRTLPT